MYINNENTTSTDYVGDIAYTDGAFDYLITGEGRVTKASDTSHFVYEYHLKDHLGNTRVAFEATSANTLKVVQKADYCPFGLQFKSGASGSGNNKYLYNGKELQDDVLGCISLGWYDYGARFYDPQGPRFLTIDPLAEKYPWQSPYCYAINNPIRYTDKNGEGPEEVIIKGPLAAVATHELQKSTTMTLSRDAATGKITATGEAKTINDKKLSEAINSPTIKVEVETTNTAQTTEGNLFVGGAFMGNTVTKTEKGNTVEAKQEVNPNVLSTMSQKNGAPGQDMLHEVTEAFEGGKISQASGVPSPNSNSEGNVYKQAHEAAIPQSGIVVQSVNDAKTQVTYSTTPYLIPIYGEAKELKPVLKVNF